MSELRSRARRHPLALAFACLMSALFLCGVCCAAPKPLAPAISASSADVVVFAPSDRSRPRPLFVMLHGMCGSPENTCAAFAGTTARLGWLICPRAARACDGGGSTWAYGERFETVERAVASVHQRFPGEIDESQGRTLIGFSLGAFVANDLAARGGARYSRVLLIGARVFPDSVLLQRAGVTRLLLAAGKYDMTHDHMAGQVRRLTRSGLPARFMDLGPVGHRFPDDFAAYLAQAFDWLGASASHVSADHAASQQVGQ